MTADLKRRAIKSAAWFAATRVSVQAVSWAVTVLLARLLSPADYGVFGMALAVIGFLEMFQEFGLGVAIVQRQELSRGQLNAVFWIMALASSTLVVVAFLGADLAAAFYREPRLTWMVRLLALTFLLTSLGLVPYNLLTREIDFRRRSLAEAIGVVSSAAVSVWLAYHGYGVWALVGGHLFRSAVRNVLLGLVCGWRPGAQVSFQGVPEMLTFGLRVAGSNVVSTLSGVVKTAIMGRLLGSHNLGLYSMGRTLGVEAPHKLYTSVINQLSLPVFSKLQRNDEELRRYFLKITKYLAVACTPLQVGMILVANDLVVLVLSEKWQAVIPLVPFFALGGLCYVLPLPSAPALTARGKARTLFRFSSAYAVVTPVVVLVGASFGLETLVVLWVVTYAVQRVNLLWLALRELGLTARRYLENICSPLVGALAMAVVVLVVRIAVPGLETPLERLALAVGTGGAGYALTVFLIDRRFGVEVVGIVHELFATSRA